MTTALLCMNLVNDFLADDGKLRHLGYAAHAQAQGILPRIHRIQAQFRQMGAKVVHARYRFSKDYYEINPRNMFLQQYVKAQALQHGTPGVDFYPEVQPADQDAVLTKHRLSAFYRTRLEIILSSQSVTDLYICGVGTRSAITTTAREALDRDFRVTVLADACADADQATHDAALDALRPFVTVDTFANIAVKLTR